MASGTARAAHILLQLELLGGDQWARTVTSSLDAPALGAVNVDTIGIASKVLATTNVGISGPDSVFTPGVFGPGSGLLIINNTPGATIAGPGAEHVLLATLTATGSFPGTTPGLIPLEIHALQTTFWDVELNALGQPYGSGDWVARRDNAFTIRLAPEPSVTALLAALASALAGTRRLRS